MQRTPAMLLSNTTKSGVVESSGYGETTRATIATSAHMFRVLSGLYSDTIGAVLREIGCNAADAHTDAGEPLRPIEVKLPNAMDRTFYIKDHGPGLDEESVRGLYLTYGASTKRDRADLIGALGLGCKSPLAYTHTFTVVSVRDGVQRHFTVYLDDTGVPAVAKTGEVPASADWPHGLMVTFPVAPSDFSAFANKARAIYRWFAVPPTLLGVGMGEEVRPAKAQYSLAGGLLKARFTESTTSGVVMGSIRYPFDSATMWGGVNDTSLAPVPIELRDQFRALAKKVFAGDVTLSVALGEVMFVPSREHLDYNPATIRSLVSLQYRALQALASHVRAELEQLKSLALYPQAQKHSALHALLEAFNINNNDSALKLAAIGGFNSNAGLMVPLQRLVMSPGLVTLGRDVGSRSLLGGGAVKVRLTRSQAGGSSKTTATSQRIEYGYLPGKTKDGKPLEAHLAANESTALVLIDVKGLTISALKSLLDVLGIASLLTVQPVKGCTVAQAQAYLDVITGPTGSLSGMPVKRLSELVSPEILVREARERVKRSQAERLAATNCLIVSPGDLDRESVANAIDTVGCTHYVVLAEGYSLEEGLRKYAYFEAGNGVRPSTNILSDTCQALTWLLGTYGMPFVDDEGDEEDEDEGSEGGGQVAQAPCNGVAAAAAAPASAYERVVVGGVLVLTKPAAARLKLKDMGLRDFFADARSAATHPDLPADILEIQSRNFTLAKLGEALSAHSSRGLGDLLRRTKRLNPIAYSRVTSLLGANPAVRDAMLVVEAEAQLATQAGTYANKALQAALNNTVAAQILKGKEAPANMPETLTLMVQAAARVGALPTTAPLDHNYIVTGKDSLMAEQLPSWVAAWLSVNRLDEDLATAGRNDQAKARAAEAGGVNVVSFEAARLTRPAFPLKPTAQAGVKG